MNTIPECPIHKKPMREGKFGYYCATKDAAGNWCKEKARPVAEQAHQASPATVQAPIVSDKARLAEAALAFAGAVYQGAGPTGEEGALALAQQAYSWLWNAEDQSVPAF
jgi:hypothetical protein